MPDKLRVERFGKLYEFDIVHEFQRVISGSK
jgi:hypothetical protein